MGGGLSWVPNYPYAAGYSLGSYHGKLLVTGVFNRAGNADVHCIASWNGQQWCGFPGEFEGTNVINSTAVWRDTLYICGGFTAIDGVPMKQVAQWVGGDAEGNCSSVGIGELPVPPPAMQLNPTGVQGQWSVHLPTEGTWRLVAYNMAGQVVGSWQSIGNTLLLDLTGKSPGLYLLRATNAKGQQLTSKLIHP